MATMCQKDFSDEDEELLRQAEERVRLQEERGGDEGVLKLFEQYREEIEVAHKARTIECLQENVENALRALGTTYPHQGSGEKLKGKKHLDFTCQPAEEQCNIQWEVGVKLSRESRQENTTLRFSFSEHALVDFPAIYGTKPVSPEVTEEIMRTLINLKSGWDVWDANVLGGIMLIDKETARDCGLLDGGEEPGGYVFSADILREQSPEPQNFILNKKTAEEIGVSHTQEHTTKEILPVILHIILDSDGKSILTRTSEQKKGDDLTEKKYIPHGKSLGWTIVHELHHLGYDRKIGEAKWPDQMRKTERCFEENKGDWVRAMEAQRSHEHHVGPTFDPKTYIRTDKALQEEELRGQYFAAWEMDSPSLCGELKDFFNNHFAEK